MSKQDLLIEIGTEELPPKALANLSKAFLWEIEQGLKNQQLAFSSSKAFATPRRLAVIVNDLDLMQPSSEMERFGPAIQAAFDADGKPTKAAEGFARSCGVDVSQLAQKDDGKVTKLFFSAVKEGQPTDTLLPAIINHALGALPIPKRMRWGSARDEFVRPVHWVIILLGSSVVPATVMGIDSGNESRGHRFHHPDTFVVNGSQDYESALLKARVVADFSKRRDMIRKQIIEQAENINARVVIDEDLLDEVTALVEWPVALTGTFDERFLDVPKEALVSSMKNHQKCFYLEDANGLIKPNFITISNLDSTHPERVIAGNERVIRPRLADAEFFFQQDKKHSLESRREKLKTVIFEQTLGTVFEKSQRVTSLARFIAEHIGADQALAVRAAELGKCDLLSGMVGEFAELQGIMGYYYALHDGEPAEVAQALNDQYLPRFSGDELPGSQTGIVLALAERIDTIVGLFGIGQPPTGSKDPFALRRAALGILRIIVEKNLSIELAPCIQHAASLFSNLPKADQVETAVLDFIFERFRAWYADAGVPAHVFHAVDAVRPASPLDFDHRIKAVSAFTALPEAEALAMANKRVSNILAKLDTQPSTTVDETLLTDEAEIALYQLLVKLHADSAPLLQSQSYEQALALMASLQSGVDRFFDQVMVNTDDLAVRSNRQALLQQLRQLFLHIADISHLQAN